MDYVIRLNSNDQWAMKKAHQHDCLEILLSLTDGGSFFLMDNRHSIHRGTLVLIEEHVLHRSVSTNDLYERFVLYIPYKTLVEVSGTNTDFLSILTRSCCLQLDEEAFLQVRRLMEQCHFQSEEFGNEVLQDCAFLSLLVTICRLLSQPTISSVPPDGLSTPIRQTIDRINSHLADELSLNSLAEHCYITKYHLCRLFKDETGFTIGEYIVRQRIFRAAALLRAGENVQKASEAVGFRNYSHFIRTFSRLMGVSPGRYQKKFKQEFS